MISRSGFSLTVRLLIAATGGALLFSRVGAWNFTIAMSGTAWLTANLFAIAAVHLRSTDRPRHAFAVAVLASISYGTGIAAWPAVAVVGVGRRGIRSAWREWPFVAALGVTYLWYQIGPRSGEGPTVALGALPGAMAEILGLVFDLGDAARALGFLALVAVPALVVVALASPQRRDAAGWAGVATYGYLASIVIAVGRYDVIETFGVEHRYYSLAALAWFGLFVLLIIDIDAVVAARRNAAEIRWLPVVVTSILTLALLVPALAGGGSQEAEMRDNWKTRQQLAEVAFRMGLMDGSSYLTVVRRTEAITPLMTAVDHYPFVDDWDLDCGLLGKRISANPDEPPMSGGLESGRAVYTMPGAVQVEGVIPHGKVRCVLIADPGGVVVGAGTVRQGGVDHVEAGPSARPIRALARFGIASYTLYVVVDGSDRPRRVGDPLPASAIEPPLATPTSAP
jgi:hypothetical protein